MTVTRQGGFHVHIYPYWKLILKIPPFFVGGGVVVVVLLGFVFVCCFVACLFLLLLQTIVNFSLCWKNVILENKFTVYSCTLLWLIVEKMDPEINEQASFSYWFISICTFRLSTNRSPCLFDNLLPSLKDKQNNLHQQLHNKNKDVLCKDKKNVPYS